MSVYFYCTAWAIAKKPEDLDAITNEQLVDIAVRPRNSPDEGQAWLTEARRIRAGTIESRTRFKMKMYAGESRGHCLSAFELSIMHPNLLFVEVSGADCTDEELFCVIKNGKTLIEDRGIVPYDHKLFALLKSDLEDENFYDKVEEACYEFIESMAGEAFRQDDHEDFEG